MPLEAAIAADDVGDEVRRPVGARLLDELGRRILSGQYPQGVPLPTELQLCAEFGVSQSTGSAKARAISDALGMRPAFDPEWTLPSMLDRNPLVWMAEVNGHT